MTAVGDKSMRGLYGWLVIIMLVTTALVTRLPAPWQLEVTNDEMHHLQSYRNRYGTDDIYPLFMRKLERLQGVNSRQIELMKSVYHSGPLAQRALIVLVDPQPPLFPIMAELIELLSNSSLLMLRMPSMIASVLSVYLMYLLGKEIKDKMLGFWLASLACLSPLAQVYAGIGRPYSIAQCALIATLWVYVRDEKHEPQSPRYLLIVALLAQSLQWMAWAVVCPLVLVRLWGRYRRGSSIRKLLKMCWWYVLASMLLLVEMFVQLKNPIVSGQAGVRSVETLWTNFALASPFAHLASFGWWGLCAGAGLFALAIAGGIIVLSRRPAFVSTDPRILLLLLLISILALSFLGSGLRFMLTYIVIPVVVGSIGLRWLMKSPQSSFCGLILALSIFGALAIVHPEDPYKRILDGDTLYSQIAARLKTELKPGDIWVAWPNFIADCLYRYGPLPEPCMAISSEELEKCIADRHPHQDAFVVTREGLQNSLPADKTWSFGNGFLLMRLPKSR